MSSLFGPGVMLLFFIFLAALIFLYVMSILWAKKDAKARGANEKFAMLISLIPFAGVLAYVLMRPPLLLIDKEEQELDIALKRRQLNNYGECPNCGELVEAHYLVCPKCQVTLKDACKNCGKPLEAEWNACPYCSTPKDTKNVFFDNNKPKKKPELKAESNPEENIEDSFSFDDDAVEEADVDIASVLKSKHFSDKLPKVTTNN